MGGDQPPALMRLTFYVGLAGLALGIKRIELKIEIMIGRFSGVDSAAQQFFGRLIHGRHLVPTSCWPEQTNECASPASYFGVWSPLRPQPPAVRREYEDQ